jgi:hypothetical protein
MSHVPDAEPGARVPGLDACMAREQLGLWFPITRSTDRLARSEHIRLGCHPLVMVMEPTDFWHDDHPALGRSENGVRCRTIHRERQMRPPSTNCDKLSAAGKRRVRQCPECMPAPGQRAAATPGARALNGL